MKPPCRRRADGVTGGVAGSSGAEAEGGRVWVEAGLRGSALQRFKALRRIDAGPLVQRGEAKLWKPRSLPCHAIPPMRPPLLDQRPPTSRVSNAGSLRRALVAAVSKRDRGVPTALPLRLWPCVRHAHSRLRPRSSSREQCRPEAATVHCCTPPPCTAGPPSPLCRTPPLATLAHGQLLTSAAFGPLQVLPPLFSNTVPTC